MSNHVDTTDQPAIRDAWQRFRAGETAQALHLLHQAGPLPAPSGLPMSAERAMLGAMLMNAGQEEGAVPYLDGDWCEAPPDAAGLAGALLLSRGRFAQALPALRHAADADTRDPAAHAVNLGRTLTLMGRSDEALPWLRRGLSLAEREHELARRSLAEALLSLGRIDEALAILPEDPDDPHRTASRALAMAMGSRHEEAAQCLQQASARHPDATALHLIALDLAELRGRLTEAHQLLHRLLAREPDNVALWARCAQFHAQHGAHYPEGSAREAAQRTLTLAEGQPHWHALALATQAMVLTEEGALAQAERAYRDALAQAPDLPAALSGLGQLLLQQGQVTQAMACFERLSVTAPLQGWSQMIHARKVPDDPAVLDAMEAAARRPSLHGPVHPSLLLTVAAAWDKKKHHDRAMRLAHEANDAAKAHLAYQPEAHRAQVDATLARYSARFMASRRGWGHPSRLPVFVLGMPRSGTTLVEQILGSHSQVHGAGELSLIPEQVQQLLAWEAKLGSPLHYPHCVTELTQAHSRQFAERLLASLRDHAPQAAHVIDKLPHNFEHIGLIKLLFPNATIFHCRRDARDIAVSNYLTDYAAKFGGMGFSYDLGWIGEQLVDHERLMAHWHAVFPGQIMEVVYEELVEDPEAWARRMLHHLALPWEDGVLNFQDLDRPVKTASVWQVRQPVYTSSKARWRRYADHLGPLEHALAHVPGDPPPAPLPSHPPGLYMQGMTQLQQGDAVMAEATFRHVLQACPGHAAAQHFLGVALLQQGRADDACAAIRLALQWLPVHPSWWDNLARAEHAAQRPAPARAAYEEGQRRRQH